MYRRLYNSCFPLPPSPPLPLSPSPPCPLSWNTPMTGSQMSIERKVYSHPTSSSLHPREAWQREWFLYWLRTHVTSLCSSLYKGKEFSHHHKWVVLVVMATQECLECIKSEMSCLFYMYCTSRCPLLYVHVFK